ncbi:hypothetical protein [Corallococcus sp. CA053C]|uniref:hypothetical protein n=1 Tax=Corallococcus sp. CA053C TaxID=2316732 RepID=UPI0011C47336|nr:hypothetical protein [Corallococcus sp. CA053C]
MRDGRAFNGPRKVNERLRETLCRVLEGTPQQSGWRRTTWTRELLAREQMQVDALRRQSAQGGKAR